MKKLVLVIAMCTLLFGNLLADDLSQAKEEAVKEIQLVTDELQIEFADNEEKSEYFVPIKWLETNTFEEAIQELGMFGNQNTVCKPTTQKWRSTVDRLKLRFPKFDKKGH